MNSDISNRSLSSHNHDSLYAKLNHTHSISDIINLQSTLDSKAASNHTHNYLPLSGGTMKGNIVIDPDIKGTDAVTWDTVDKNTSIKFSTKEDPNQCGALVWNCWDNYQNPASLTFLGNQGGEYFIAPNIKSSNWVICDGMGKDETMCVSAMLNNEINFGGNNNSSTIYFGYRAKGSKPIPTDFKFGGSKGTANIFAHLYHTDDWYGHLVRPTSSSPGTHEMYWAY